MTKYGGPLSAIGAQRARVEHVLALGKEIKDIITDEGKVQGFMAKYDNLKDLINKHEQLATQMLEAEDKPASYDEAELYKSLIAFDDLVTEIQVIYRGLSGTLTENRVLKQDSFPVKLPRISLPTFAGAVQEWPTFLALFDSIVTQNKGLSAVEKLQYLRSSLKGEALDLVKGLSLVPQSFDISIQLLKDRFDNVRKIATLHAEQLMAFPVSHSPSAKHLRSLIAAYREHTEALRAMGAISALDANTADGLFLFLILIKKIDSDTRCQFERSLTNNREIRTTEQLIKFLEQECQALESLSDCSKASSRRSEGVRSVMLVANSPEGCPGCSKPVDHRLHKCKRYLSLSVKQRKDIVTQNRLCFNCLREHLAVDCTSEGRCSECGARHHTTLHWGKQVAKDSTGLLAATTDSDQVEGNEEDMAEELVATVSNSGGQRVILSTILVGIRNGTGQLEMVRGLLDSGSQASYVTADCVQRLKLPQRRVSVKSSALGQNGVMAHGAVVLDISNRFGKHIGLSSALVLKRITGKLPSVDLPAELKSHLENLVLADPDFDKSRPIDCLIGADIFAACLKDGRQVLGNGLPVAFNTSFGWILMGGLQMPRTMEPQDPLAFHVMCETPVDEVLRGFWELEEVPGTIQPTQTYGAEVCEKHFRDTYSRDEDGRYVVRLPFNNKGLELGYSYHIAQHRYLALERRLDRDKEMRTLYMDFMKEYLEAGHMELVDNPDVASTKHYYMPHHGVLKLSSSTTKLRVVFDASCKTASGSKCSLNDMLLEGPKLQRNLVEILLRFRSYPFVFTADIKQMFRGVWLHKEDRNFQLYYGEVHGMRS